MDLREPKKKKRVRLQPQASLPISTNDDGEWRIYTAHLSACGTCIVDPNEMKAVYSMGFFGKGSLSRSFPSFGRRRFGAPQMVRNRQWIRRQKWLEELELLNRDANSEIHEDFEMSLEHEMDENSPRESIANESLEFEKAQESNVERPAESQKIIDDDNEKKSSLEVMKMKSSDKTDPETSLKVFSELKNTPEKETNNDSLMEFKTDSSSDQKSDKSNSESPRELEKINENEIDTNESVEYVEEKSCDRKDPKYCSEVPDKLEETTEIDNDSLVELKTVLGDKKPQESDSKASKLTKTVVNEIDENSLIEFITDESCIKRARMGNTEKLDIVEITKDDDDKKDDSSMVCNESANIDEVLLDSTEEEEIFEIFEKSTNDAIGEICEIVDKITKDGKDEICEIVEKSANEDIFEIIEKRGNEEICQNVAKSTNDSIEEISEISEKSSNDTIQEICDVERNTNGAIEEIAGKSTTTIEKRRSSTHDDKCILNNELVAGKNHNFSHNDEDDEKSIIEEETNLFEVLVLPDTDSDTDNYLKNVKSRIEKGGFPVNETLHLTFEETFFLMYGLGCLQLVHYDGSIFSINNAWIHFQQQDQYFIQKYVIYHYFRSKGWVVKPGLKFGGDFLLYKQGPPFYHASYIVIIEVMDADTLIRDNVKSPRKITWKNLIGLERLSETIAKEILFAQILWPSSIVRNGTPMPVETLSEFTVRELLWRRWDPKRKIDNTSVDEEDSDST